MMTDHVEEDGIPSEVRARMEEAGVPMEYRRSGKYMLEARTVGDGRLEVREADNGAPAIAGYPAVFEYEYPVKGGPELGGFTEIIERSAFTRTLGGAPDVRFLYEHMGGPVARTTSGTLALSVDGDGFRSDTPSGLDMRNPDAARMVSMVERGDATEMSFAFRVPKGGASWNQSYTERRVREVALNRGDVSLCPFGASDATVAVIQRSAEVVEHESGLVSVEFARAFAMRSAGDSTTPGETFDDVRAQVCSAVCDAFGAVDDNDYYTYVDNLSATWAVYSTDGQLYQVSYSIDADGTVTLGDPVKVRRQTSYVELPDA